MVHFSAGTPTAIKLASRLLRIARGGNGEQSVTIKLVAQKPDLETATASSRLRHPIKVKGGHGAEGGRRSFHHNTPVEQVFEAGTPALAVPQVLT